MCEFYQFSGDKVSEQLKTTADGLNKQDIVERQEQYGLNLLKGSGDKSRIEIFLSQFGDLLIVILLFAALISFLTGETNNALVIIGIIFINAVIGFHQEYKADRSLKLLRKVAEHPACVIREGSQVTLEASKLVPGDIIILETGDIVPADARLLNVSSFKTDESSLTGESIPVIKQAEPIDLENLMPADQLNMVFKSTSVVNGSAKAVVTKTGMKTQIGTIAAMIQVDVQKTPMQISLAQFSRQLALFVLIISLTIFALGILRGLPPFPMFLTTLSLAVAALPEALPAVVTIALTAGARRMANQSALVRRLPAVETLGSVTYICTDKTGTLTKNTMTVEKVHVARNLHELFAIALMLNNEVRVIDTTELKGDTTEIAMIKHSSNLGYIRSKEEAKFPRLKTFPFDSYRMRMSTLHKYGSQWILLVKGAPNKIVDVLCPKDKSNSEDWLRINQLWASEGLRVLFLAYRVYDQHPGDITETDEADLQLLGIVGFLDPPREEVREAIAQCEKAGISIVMLTGDQALTAQAIATRLGLIHTKDCIQTGSDLEKLSDEEFRRIVLKTSVYARVTPSQKLRIVKALQYQGEIVAMTGDGINDAPSLKRADIGIAMGITGTAVSKEASDMVLLDDNFITVVKAVREGRRIYENIRKFIYYVLSCNLAEILTILAFTSVGSAAPLLPIHILWINLVTDGLPGIALATEPATSDIMIGLPNSSKRNIFEKKFTIRIMTSAIIMTTAAISVQVSTFYQGVDVNTQQTAVFTTLCLVQLSNALSVRTLGNNLIVKAFFANKLLWIAIISTLLLQVLIIYVPILNTVFQTSPLNLSTIAVILVATAGNIFFMEKVKLLVAPNG